MMLGINPLIGATHNPGTLKTNLLACWEMDDPSGTNADDAHTNNYDMTHLTSGPTVNQSIAKMNKSVLYDGVDDYTKRDAVNTLSPVSAHSINIWVNRQGDSSADVVSSLMSRYNSTTGNRIYTFYLYPSNNATTPNRLRGNYYDSTNASQLVSYDPGSDIWTGNWMMCTYTRDGSSMKLYVNGDEVASASSGNGSMQQSSNVSTDDMIGAVSRSSTTPDNFLHAYVDQTAVWDKALTEAEVKFLYNQGSGAPYSIW